MAELRDSVGLANFYKIRAMVWGGKSPGVIQACFPWVSPKALAAAIHRAKCGTVKPAIRNKVLELKAKGKKASQIAKALDITEGQAQWAMNFWQEMRG